MCPVRSVTYVSGRSHCEPDFLDQGAEINDFDGRTDNRRAPLYPWRLCCRTCSQSKVLTGNAAGQHAAVTERLEAAGGVLLGKLSTHEFAIGGRPSICRGRPRATLGTAIASAAARRAAAARDLPLVSFPPRSAPIRAARSAIPPRCAASPG
jgi:Amidase